MIRFKISVVLLQGVFILSKLENIIDVSWVIVLSPIIAICAFIVGFKIFNKRKVK